MQFDEETPRNKVALEKKVRGVSSQDALCQMGDPAEKLKVLAEDLTASPKAEPWIDLRQEVSDYEKAKIIPIETVNETDRPIGWLDNMPFGVFWLITSTSGLAAFFLVAAMT